MSVKSSLGRQFSLSLVAAVAGAVLASSAGAAVAHAQAADAAPALKVKYKTSDLTSREGSQALYKRITIAAGEVCDVTNHEDVGGFTKYEACKRAAIERAVNELKSPQLAAVHSNHSHKG